MGQMGQMGRHGKAWERHGKAWEGMGMLDMGERQSERTCFQPESDGADVSRDEPSRPPARSAALRVPPTKLAPPSAGMPPMKLAPPPAGMTPRGEPLTGEGSCTTFG